MIDWSEIFATTATMTWLMPSVAMKLLTFSLTTKNPETNPANAQATRAMTIAAISGVLSVLTR